MYFWVVTKLKTILFWNSDCSSFLFRIVTAEGIKAWGNKKQGLLPVFSTKTVAIDEFKHMQSKWLKRTEGYGNKKMVTLGQMGYLRQVLLWITRGVLLMVFSVNCNNPSTSETGKSSGRDFMLGILLRRAQNRQFRPVRDPSSSLIWH